MAERALRDPQPPDPTRHRQIWRLTWPVLLANLTIPLVGIADTAVMGQLTAPAYIGAVALGATLFSAIYWCLGFLRMSTTALAAQALGASRIAEVVAVFIRASAVALLLGLLLIALQPLIWPLAELAFNADPDVMEMARQYYQIRIWSAPAVLLYLVELGLLFGLQQPRATMVLSAGLSLTNLLLDVYLVIGLGYDVDGVAMGTLISEWGTCLFGLLLVYSALRRAGWTGGKPPELWQSERLAGLFQVSRDLIIRAFFVQFPFFATTALGARFGELTLAANAILMQFYMVTIYAMDAFAHTAETLTGYAWGAVRPQLLRQAAWRTGQWALGISALASLSLWLSGDWLIAQMSKSLPVQQLAGIYLPWVIALPLVSVLAFQLDGIFIGTTQTRTMRNNMFAAWCGYCIVLWLSLDTFGNHALWLALSVFMISRALLLGRHYPALESSLATNQSTAIAEK